MLTKLTKVFCGECKQIFTAKREKQSGKLIPRKHKCKPTPGCPECDSLILPSQYCMMGHWCGKR